MNDSFTNISSPVPRSAGGRFGGKGQTVQILNLPADLSGNPRTLRLEGQITSLRANNTAQIQTPAGNIDVQIKGNRPPQIGQTVEIEIPPARRDGQPAKQGLIRPTAPQTTGNNSQNIQPNIPDSAKIRATYQSPAQPTPQTQSIAPRQTIPNQIISPVPQPTTTVQNTPQGQAVVNVEQNALLNRTALPPVLPTGAEQTTQIKIPQTAITQTLEAGNVVRLLPTPPAQAQNIATQFLQNLPAPVQNIVTQTAFNANLVTQNIQNNSSQSVFQNISPTQIQTPQNALNLSSQNITQPIQNNSILPNVTATTLQPQPLAQTIPQGQTLPIQSAEIFLQGQSITASTTHTQNLPLNATLTPAPISAQIGNATPSPIQLLGQIDVQVLKITPPPAVLNASTVATSPQQVIPAATNFTPHLISSNTAPTITGQVTGFTTQSLPLVTVQWPGARIPQSFVLQGTPNNLQLGSQLQLIPKASPLNLNAVTTGATGLVQSTITNPLFQGFQWPALDNLFLSLQQSSPQAAASLTRSLPNAGNPAQLATAAMSFIAAVRSGDLGSWLGNQKMDALRQIGKSDILSSLTQSGRGGAQGPAADTAPVSDWRAVPLPMFWEGEIHRITLYTRREDGGDQKQDQENDQTRFVFDLSLSRMGDIQLDGLLRDKRLDLVIRAQNAFSLSMQQTMRQAYSTALDQTELSGELNFQGSTKNWVHVLEQKEELGMDA